MKRLLFLLGALLVAVPASGAVFETEVLGSLQFSNLGRVEATASGTGLATVNGSAGALPGHLTTLSTNRVPGAALNTVIAVTDPIVTAGGIVEVRLTDVEARPDLQGGIFAPISGALQSTALDGGGTMAGSGQVRICLIEPGCEPGSTLTLEVAATSNGEYIGGGVGGLLTIGGEGGIRISIFGAPWTVKTVTVSNRTNNGGITFFQKNGFAHGPASLTSSTAATGGVVQLVSANQTITAGIPGNGDKQGNITQRTVHFTPEPGLLLLLGAGVAGVTLLGYKRRK